MACTSSVQRMLNLQFRTLYQSIWNYLLLMTLILKLRPFTQASLFDPHQNMKSLLQSVFFQIVKCIFQNLKYICLNCKTYILAQIAN